MLRTHKLAGLIRSQLAVLALLFLGGTLVAPQAIAQCGTNTVLLQHNQWAMVGVPCVPPIPGNTVAEVFGPSLSAEGPPNYGYGTASGSWIAYKKGYNAAQCPTASDPNNCYIKLAGTDTIARGDALWIYSLLDATLDFSSIGASNTPGPYVEFPANIAPSNAVPRYTMFANPYEDTVSWADLRFTGTVFGNPISLPTNLASFGLFSVISPNVHYWNGNTYYTRSLTSNPAATFVPKEAAWIEMLRGVSPFIQNLMVRVPDPTP